MPKKEKRQVWICSGCERTCDSESEALGCEESHLPQVTCPECNGAGEFATSHVWSCHLCNGKGNISLEKAKQWHKEKRENDEIQELREQIEDNLGMLDKKDLVAVLKFVTNRVEKADDA